jgi:hypothetical protein
MKSILSITAVAAMLVGLANPSPAVAVPKDKAEVAAAAEIARRLSIDELYKIYAGKTWVWEDGAAYFQVPKRRFVSWVRSGKKGSYAEGNWFLTARGEACFRARWHAFDGISPPKASCFEHRTDGKRIFQRRSPAGEWTEFKRSPPKRYDGIRYLKPGDRVTRNFERNKRYLAKNAPPSGPCYKPDPLMPFLCRMFGN